MGRWSKCLFLLLNQIPYISRYIMLFKILKSDIQVKSYKLFCELLKNDYWRPFFCRPQYELRSVTHKNPPAPADDSTVRYLAVELLYGAESYRTLIKFSCPGGSAPANDCTVQVLYREIISRYELYLLRSLYGGHRLQDFVNSTGKFNSIVVKTLKPVLCFYVCKRKLADTLA